MLVTALTPVLGYDKASSIARHAHEQGLSLKESALILGYISGEDFDLYVNPQRTL